MGLKPKFNAKPRRSTRYMSSPGYTTKSPKAYILNHFTDNLSSPSPPISSSQNAASYLTPNNCSDKLELQEEQPTQPSTLSPSSNSLKRKIKVFSKRLRKAASGPKPVFFDPDTFTLIPQSRLEFFILNERQKAEDEEYTRKFFP